MNLDHLEVAKKFPGAVDLGGETTCVLWSGNSAYYNAPLGTDTFVMRNGKIIAQTFAAQLEAE
jgi:hypothetical protein